MDFLVSYQSENSCKDVLSQPFTCFLEYFSATPPILGTFLSSFILFGAAVALWAAIFAAILYALYFVLMKVCCASQYFFHKTRLGRKISSIVPLGPLLEKFCCKAKEVQPKRLINTQAIGEYGANIAAKVHVDSKLFKFFKGNPFHSKNESDGAKSPSKTPQRSTSRLSQLTPKLLSPKVLHK